MVVCNYCSKKELSSRRFTLPFTCKECEVNTKNYASTINDEIIYIDSNGKHINTNIDEDLEINIESEKPIDITDYKDALLASLYSQVELLRTQITEKDLLIRALIIQNGENDLCNNVAVENVTLGDARSDESVYEVLSKYTNENMNTHEISNRIVDYDISTTTEITSNNERSLETQFRIYRDLLSDHCTALMSKFINQQEQNDQYNSTIDATTSTNSTT